MKNFARTSPLLIALLPMLLATGCAHQELSTAARTPSSGPGSTPPVASLEQRLYQGPFEVPAEGLSRAATKVYLPLQYDEKKAWPLVVLLHGFTGSGEGEDTYLTLRHRVSFRGFILATPDGLPTPAGTVTADGSDISGKQFWNATEACCDFARTRVNDVAFLTKLITTLKARYAVDGRRVYLIGHSNGGFMANRLACEIGPELAGVANLGGGSFGNEQSCRQPTPVPYLQIHALDDSTIGYEAKTPYAGGKETVAQWRRRNGCDRASTKGPARDLLLVVPGNDTTTETWRGCASGKEVEFWTLRAYESKLHNAHVPLFQLGFTDAVLEFLLRQSK